MQKLSIAKPRSRPLCHFGISFVFESASAAGLSGAGAGTGTFEPGAGAGAVAAGGVAITPLELPLWA